MFAGLFYHCVQLPFEVMGITQKEGRSARLQQFR